MAIAPSALAELENQLPAIRSEAWRRRLFHYVEWTANVHLDAWQKILCARLERLKDERGVRLLIHAPPQHGKSIIVSQRLPAWLLGHNPILRVKLACYNQTHAGKFSRVVRDLMSQPEYLQAFPDARLSDQVPIDEWFTEARKQRGDAQPSFAALGLETGFTGQGVDTLIIDDPYPSAKNAESEAYALSLETFWRETARPRLNERTNVVVMFHRYRENDFAGQLIEDEGLVENGGKWELMRFPAECDDESTDLLGRREGEYLSPRYPASWYEEQKIYSMAWLSQFQGTPTAKEGAFFKVGMMEIVDAAPVGLRECRAWDVAALEGDGDFTAGVKIGVGDDGFFYVTDVARGQWSTDNRNRIMRQTAELDGISVSVRVPQDPGSAGTDAVRAFTMLLAGFRVETVRPTGDKATRADPFSAQVNAGNVRLVRGEWNRAFIEELRAFPQGKHDDQVDAAADAFNKVAVVRKSISFS